MSEPAVAPFHTHVNEDGLLVRCYHKCKKATSVLGTWQFWFGMTMGFPFEHFLWEKVPPFSWITHWIGL